MRVCRLELSHSLSLLSLSPLSLSSLSLSPLSLSSLTLAPLSCIWADDDALGVLLCIDYYALRCRMFDFVQGPLFELLVSRVLLVSVLVLCPLLELLIS